jgi:hypothetical protein
MNLRPARKTHCVIYNGMFSLLKNLRKIVVKDVSWSVGTQTTEKVLYTIHLVNNVRQIFSTPVLQLPGASELHPAGFLNT